MPLDKDYLCTRGKCRVRFILDGPSAPRAKRAYLVGEFNRWKRRATPMNPLPGGGFCCTLDLPVGREFQFRYLVDGKWRNEREADRYQYVPEFDQSNSVIVV